MDLKHIAGNGSPQAGGSQPAAPESKRQRAAAKHFRLVRYFSVASLWEMTVKLGRGRADFKVDPRLLRRNMVDNGYVELPVGAEHALATLGLPPIHKDPVDRMLVAQAIADTAETGQRVLAGLVLVVASLACWLQARLAPGIGSRRTPYPR